MHKQRKTNIRKSSHAGINGNIDARIFCQQLGAEMLSIAGHYKVAEDLRRDPLWGKAAQTSPCSSLE